MNLAIDIGNTAVKWALFEGRELVKLGNSEFGIQNSELKYEHVLACASGDNSALNPKIPILNSQFPLPIRLNYKTPQSLGADRIADACGAWALHRGEASLIIDAGTCITVDYLDADGVYHGGAIMPGLTMCLTALAERTARLPLVSLDGVTKAPVLGRSTEESILAGTLGATMLALAGYVATYRQHSPQLHVLLTGGDAARLVDAGATGWEHVDNLVLHGLNEIMMYDEKH